MESSKPQTSERGKRYLKQRLAPYDLPSTGEQSNRRAAYRTGLASFFSDRGQSLTELTLILPLLLLLGLGAIEFGNMIYAYNVLAHLTREGANLTSRGTPADQALTAVIDSSGPLIVPGNQDRWRVIYTMIGPTNPDGPTPPFVVLRQRVRGAAAVDDRRICKTCDLSNFDCTESCKPASNIPDIPPIAPGQTFHAIEVFYDYSPLTPLENFSVLLPKNFYERAIFREVQQSPPLESPPCPPEECPSGPPGDGAPSPPEAAPPPPGEGPPSPPPPSPPPGPPVA